MARWQHPSLGLLRAAEFIGVSEDCGLIVPLGRWRVMEAFHSLIRNLGLNAIATEIEEPAQIRGLLNMGCEVGQGELLCDTCNASQFAHLLFAGLSDQEAME